ncbi:MAG: HEAT repeat domain-containing protein [Nitrososphaerota archaeon]|nr:HEAT repeat domain-containing protein [Nitrososphaerota archaeon]MDG6952708.1 HEAT repeat domain-containing protein [Nitrososphaerota archaeon]MDG6955787.1 HEAT repeat domain-containing protein [Nitrososphaerota archaeon]MDG6957441.1 HEAT repeat domain-containing protein [Nitrososphaerota archaeon]MDG6959141.1 HEAT repeat domain-containing protein [Nitrososphaerota archaeon]
MYTSTVVDDEAHAMRVMRGMEEAWERKDESYFIEVLKSEPSLVLRVHAVCILAEVGGEKSVPTLADVLLHDTDPLVRHEAAFSLGQIGLSEGNRALAEAVVHDRDPIVRHESAAALGSVGSADSEDVLMKAESDPDEMVRNSAKASLFNIRFLKQYSSAGETARDRAPRP